MKKVLIDGSCIVTEAMARAGADAFIGYPITPANLLYQYAGRRFPLMIPAPDEITVVQWMSGLSACGRIPATATSFPGFALMLESINMAFMMELPMIIILVQRLGPATGTATCGAQGDITLLRGMISGGHQLPVLCPSGFTDCWKLGALSVSISAGLRSPVIFLTSKEMMMTVRSFDTDKLGILKPVKRVFYQGDDPYKSYQPAENGIPPFLPVTSSRWQVRLNASTHDNEGILQHSTPGALDNTRRLDQKAVSRLPEYTFFDLDEQDGACTIIMSYGITSAAAGEAVAAIRKRGIRVSLLVAKTLFPVPDKYYEILDRYERVVIAEENINAQYARILFGARLPERVIVAGNIGKMVRRDEIIKKVISPL